MDGETILRSFVHLKNIKRISFRHPGRCKNKVIEAPNCHDRRDANPA